ncbi:hypothetical protein HCJ76_44125 [Streptomyces sp. MC1]|uniref:hypothetical protein n=1 Tax=Streptomyces sp. MC1 TaxID=295105 RepID=UPI0018CAE035|nr:hypothetical protein [Streptomyces sp. MC1]MBG7704872.1 hypothetical protein [Streptomyces sp. MC1]
MPFTSITLIPFDPYMVGREYGVRELTPRLLERGTKGTRQHHDWLNSHLKRELNALECEDAVPAGLALRLRSVGGMTYVTFSSGLLGSGRISSGIDVLTGRAVFQVNGSGVAAPLAASVLGGVRDAALLDMKRPLRVVTRPKGPAAFDTALYRPDRLMTFRPRGLGRTDASRHTRVDLMTCWVGSESLRGLLRSVVTGVEIAREHVERSMPRDTAHAYADDSVRAGR